MQQDANIGRGPARRDLWPGQRPKPLLRVIYMSLRAVFDRMRARLLQCDTSEIPPPFSGLPANLFVGVLEIQSSLQIKSA